MHYCMPNHLPIAIVSSTRLIDKLKAQKFLDLIEEKHCIDVFQI